MRKAVDVEVWVDPGQNVALRFVDRLGKPLSGMLQTSGIDPLSRRTNSNSAVVWALSAGETRIIWIKHNATGLSKYMEFTAKPGKTERTITLEPPAVLTGRFVSPEKKPYADWSVTCHYALDYHARDGFPPVRTNTPGRFRYEIPAGGPFEVIAHSGPIVTLAHRLTVQAGEQIDFGELVVDDREDFIEIKMPPKRTQSPVANASQEQEPAATEMRKNSKAATVEQSTPHAPANSRPHY